MNILYLLTEPFGVGGVQSDILALSDDLSKRGHQVYVATTTGELLEELKQKGAHYVEIDFRYRGLGGLFQAVRALRQAIRHHSIEVLAPQSVRSSIVAFVAMRLLWNSYRVPTTGRRLPIITTIHNIHNARHFSYAGYILRCCADFVIFESNYERDRLLRSGLRAEDSRVIHSGIDTERFLPLPADRDLATFYGLELDRQRIFGIVARLSEEKGHCHLVDAFALLRRDNADCRLVIVGDGPLRAEIEQRIEALDLGDVVTMTGTQRDIPRFLSIFHVFVLSSTRESFPLAAREAMAAGKAVLAPRIGGCGEVVDDGVTGLLFEAGNSADLAHCMRHIIANDRYVEFGRAGRARIEQLFSRRAWIDGDEQVYRHAHSA